MSEMKSIRMRGIFTAWRRLWVSRVDRSANELRFDAFRLVRMAGTGLIIARKHSFPMAEPTSRRRPRWQPALLAGLAAAALAGGAHGQEAEQPAGQSGLRLSGFGSLGVSHVDAPAGWGYRRELTQTGTGATWRGDVDTRLGLQLNYTLGSQVELVAQAIAKKRGSFSADSDALEWAYATYRPNAEWTLRAGRVNVDAFLMADYRNVGYAFTAARPPVELYARLPTTLDGGDVARSWFQGEAQWRVKLMAGSTDIGDTNFSKAGRLNAVVAGMVSREEGGWLLRASVARARIDFDQTDIQPGLAFLGQIGGLPLPAIAAEARMLRERVSANGIPALFTELGVRYESADWQWSAELVRVSAAPLTTENTAYATLGHRLGDWTPYVGYGVARNSVAVLSAPVWQDALTPVIGPTGAAQAQLLGSAATGALNGARLEQSSWSLGVRWDFHPQAALKLQWDRVRIPTGGSSLWTGADGTAARATVTTAVVDFIF
jgi:hypothetical protein